jgi:hypothetical protein
VRPAPGSPSAGDPPGASRARSRLASLFAIDLRTLALFRAALACALLFDWLTRSRDLVAHYTEAGVLPVAALRELYGDGVLASPFAHLSGSTAAVAALFAAGVLAALALLVGWHARLASIASWLLLVALQVRNPLVAAMGGDKFLRIVLFWSLFLPLGARWSLDARRRGEGARGPGRVLGVPSAALLLQVCLMYWVTGLRKSGPAWLDGSAVYWALHIDLWATPLGVWLREHETWLPPLTHLVRGFEVLGPFLAFIPVRTAAFRLLAIGLFAAFHLSLAACLDIGPFPLFSLVAWTAFVPSWLWDEALPRLRGARRPAPRPPPTAAGAPAAVQVIAGLLLAYVLAFAGTRVASDVFGLRVSLPGPIVAAGRALRINQGWGMFAPEPRKEEIWPVFHGRMANGRVVDPLRDAPVWRRKPERLSASFPSFRWRLYLAYAMAREPGSRPFELLFGHLGGYLCRRWNAAHAGAERLRAVDVEYWRERSGGDVERGFVFRHRCREPGS